MEARPRPAMLQRSTSSASQGKSFWANLEPERTLEDFPEFDPDGLVNSPRSVQACESEGILPEELAYTPLDMFCIPGVSREVAQMRYDYHEARRQDLLAHARSRREVLLRSGELGPSSKPGAGLLIDEAELAIAPGAPPSVSPCPKTMAFFKARQEELSPFNEGVGPGSPTSSNAHSAAPSPPPTQAGFSPSASLNKGEAVAGTATGGSQREAAPLQILDSDVEEFGEDSPKRQRDFESSSPPTASPMRSLSEPALIDLLSHLRACPNSDRVETDCAKNTENNLIALRRDRDKAVAFARKEELRLIAKRNASQEHCFERLTGGIIENRYWRQFREEMISPNSKKNDRQEAREEAVKALQHNFGKDLVKRRVDYMQSYAADKAMRKARLANDWDLRKMAVAQHSIEQRIRWRHKYDDECRRKQQEYDDNMQDLEEREARYQWRRSNRVNNGDLRKELKSLRKTNRELNTEQRARKDAFIKVLEKQARETKFPRQRSHANSAAVLSPGHSRVASPASQASSSSPGKPQRRNTLSLSRSVPTHMPSPTAAAAEEYHPIFESWTS